MEETLTGLRGLAGIDGAALLSTCNRVEAIVSAASEDVLEPVVDWLCARASANRDELEKHLYVLRHADVIKHLYRVASGLDSMIVGEPQIGGQVREAFLFSRERGGLDSLLSQLFDQTMRVAKKVRTDTGIGEHAVSVPFAAVELAKKIFGDLQGLQVLLLGAGEMGELTAEHLSKFGLKQIFVANRSYDRAIELAQRFSGEAIQFGEIEPYLATCDIVIASTAAPHYVIAKDQVERALASRKMKNLFLIDLSVPRNIDPAIANVDGAYLYNIDDLQLVAESNRELQQRLEEIRAAELEKCLRRVGPMTAEQRESLELMTTQLGNKILHYPILQLKEADEPQEQRESIRKTIRKIFGLR